MKYFCLLFSVYTNNNTKSMKNSKLSRHTDNLFVGHVTYTDVLTLISSSVLQKMINT